MKTCALVVALVAAWATTAHAQATTGEVFAGAGAFMCCQGTASAWQVGAAVMVPVGHSVSLAGDVGGVGPIGEGIVPEQFGHVTFGRVFLGTLSAAYQFGSSAPHRPRPFVSAGIGALIGGDVVVAGPTFGGGFDLWTTERRGLRVEVRDQLLQEFGTSHVVTVRVGLLVR